MKNKQEELTLLDTLSQVDNSLTQQAYDVDSAKKFHALGKAKLITKKQEKPTSLWRSWGAMAACLALILLIAASPWIVPSLLPPIHTATQPSQPATTEPVPTTTAPTQPTTIPIPVTEVALNTMMDIWFHGDIHLQCAYVASTQILDAKQTITVALQITNAGAAFAYTGTLKDQLGTALLRSDENTDYTIESQSISCTNSEKPEQIAHLEGMSIVYEFIVPADAPEDHYTLETTLFGNAIVFNAKATLRPPYVTCLTDLPEEAQKIIARGDYGTDSYKDFACSVPVYGEYEDVYVVFYPGYGSTWVTSEIVNGLKFTYGSSLQIKVFTPEKQYGLKEAFDLGILNAEQVNEIYEKWVRVGTSISKTEYDPHIRLIRSMQLNHWGEMRVGYDYLADQVGSSPGDTIRIKVELINYGPETTYDSIKDEIGATAWLISNQTGFTLESIEYDGAKLESRDNSWPTGRRASIYFTFKIPEEFDEGTYTFVFTAFGEEIRFDAKAAENDRNLSIVRFIDSYTLHLNGFYDSEFQGHMPVYGEFDIHYNGSWNRAYVYIYPTDTADSVPTTEMVNGLQFEVPAGYRLYVILWDGGVCTLTEAFDAGILTEEMLQEVYDNYIFLQNSASSIQP